MAEERESVYDARVCTGRTTYFFDVRQAVNGRYYLIITESRRNTNGNFDQKRIIIFEDGIPGFQKEIALVLGKMEELVGARGEEDLTEVRKLHPRAFMKWDENEEAVLSEHFTKGKEIEEIATEMGRTTQAVLSRLEKLGLIEPAAEENPDKAQAV